MRVRVALTLALSSRPSSLACDEHRRRAIPQHQKSGSDQESLYGTFHGLHHAGENTAILGCARRLAYATKTLCDTGSTVKV
jgi:hypothetical protein